MPKRSKLNIFEFIDIPLITFIFVLVLGMLIAFSLFFLDFDQILLNKGTVDFSSLIIAAVTMSGLSIAVYSIGKLNPYTHKNLLIVTIGFIISSIFMFFNLIYAGLISINLKTNLIFLHWLFLFSLFAGYIGLIIFFISTAGLLFLLLKIKFPENKKYKVKKQISSIIILFILFIVVALISFYGNRPGSQNTISSVTPPLNGQFINFDGSSLNDYLSSQSRIINGNAIGGNLTLFAVGNVTFFNNSYRNNFRIYLNFGVYPDFKQINLTFYENLPLRINATDLSYNSGDYPIFTSGNGYYRKPIIVYTQNGNVLFNPGEYTIALNIESVPYNFTLSANKYPEIYLLFTVDGLLETSQNFLYNFNIYLKVYPNESSFCSAQPSFC